MVNDKYMSSVMKQAAKLLEDKILPMPPTAEELRGKYALSEEYSSRVRSLAKDISKRRSRKVLKTLILIAAIISILIAFAVCMTAYEKKLHCMEVLAVTLDDGRLSHSEISGRALMGTAAEENGFSALEGYEEDTLYEAVDNERRYTNGERYYILIENAGSGFYAADTENLILNQMQINDSIVYYCVDSESGYVFMTAQTENVGYTVRGTITLEEGVEIFIRLLG